MEKKFSRAMFSANSSLEEEQTKTDHWDITDSIDLRKSKDIFYLKPVVSYVSNELSVITQKNYAKESQEAYVVRNLPVEWEPNYRKSERLEAFFTRRKNRHQELNEDMLTNMESVNEEIENDVRLRSEEIKAIITELRIKIGSVVESFITDDVGFKIDQLTICVRSMTEIYDQTIDRIETYYEQLKQIEENRKEKLKKVLQKYYMQIWKNAYLIPYDLQTFFDHQIMRINQNILANHRTYEDIRMKLILQLNFNTKQHLETLDYVYHDRKRQFRRFDKSYSFINDKCGQDDKSIMINSNMTYDDETLRETLCHFEMGSPKQKQPQTPIDSLFLEEWIDELKKTIELILSCSKDLIGFIKFAMNQTINDRTQIEDEFEQFYTEIEDDDDDNNSVDSLPSRSSYTSIQNLKSNLQELFTLQRIETLWDAEFEEFFIELQSVFRFVCDVGVLWQGHFARINEAQNLILKYIENINKDHQEAQMEREMIIGTQIDKLRQEWKLRLLDDYCKKVVGLLNEKRALMVEQLNLTITALQRYDTLVETEIELFQEEIKRFLETYPKHEMSMSVSRYNQMSRLVNILKEIKMCEYQVSAVNNWKYGLWDGIEKFQYMCDDILRKQEAKWINQQTEEIKLFFDVKLEIHDVREKRIRTEIYDVRKLEILNHETRFTRHKNAVEKLITGFHDEVLKLSRHFEHRLIEIKAEIDDFNVNLTKETKTSVMLPYKDKITQLLYEYNNEIHNKIETMTIKFKNIINEIKDSNLHYMNSITCFGQGGNFHPTEAQHYLEYLVDIDKKMEKEVKEIRRDITKQEKQMFKMIENATTSLTMMYDNVLFDLKFIETSMDIIKHLQADLKRLVFDTKYRLGKITSEVDDIEAFIAEYKTSTDPKLTSLIRNRITKLFDNMDELKDYLQQPKIMLKLLQQKELKPLSSDKNKGKKKSKSLKSSKSTKSEKSERSTKKSTRTKFKPADYLPKLFTETCSHDPTFIMDMCRMIYEALEKMQLLAIGFYKDKCLKPIIKTDLIHPDYDIFMSEILTKYRCYHLQCEESWIDIVQEYIKAIAKIKFVLSRFEKDFIQNFRYVETENFEKVNQENMKAVKCYQRNITEQWEALHDKLKPLYGHPNNSKLLHDLEILVDDFLNGCVTTIMEEIDAFQQNIKKMESDYELKLHKICKNFDALTSKVLHEEISIHLIRQLYERIKKEKMFVKPSFLSRLKKGGKKKKSARDDDTMSMTSKVSKISKSSKVSRMSKRTNASPDKFQISNRFQVPPDHRISVGLHHMRLPLPLPPDDIRDQFETVEPFQDMLIDKYSSLYQVRVESLEMMRTCKNMQGHVASYLEEFNTIKEMYEQIFSDNLIRCHSLPEKWRHIWKSDVEKVLNLYVVKYK